jgi:hypothetical protein
LHLLFTLRELQQFDYNFWKVEGDHALAAVGVGRKFSQQVEQDLLLLLVSPSLRLTQVAFQAHLAEQVAEHVSSGSNIMCKLMLQPG